MLVFKAGVSYCVAWDQRRDYLRTICASWFRYHGAIPIFSHGVPARRSQHGAYPPGQRHNGWTSAQFRRWFGLCGKRQRNLFSTLLPVDAVQRFPEIMFCDDLNCPYSILREFLPRMHLRHLVPGPGVSLGNLQGCYDQIIFSGVYLPVSRQPSAGIGSSTLPYRSSPSCSAVRKDVQYHSGKL